MIVKGTSKTGASVSSSVGIATSSATTSTGSEVSSPSSSSGSTISGSGVISSIVAISKRRVWTETKSSTSSRWETKQFAKHTTLGEAYIIGDL